MRQASVEAERSYASPATARPQGSSQSPTPRETAAEAITALKEIGVRPVMLTGDNRETAERIVREPGIDEVIAEVLPEEEAQKVKELEQQGRKVAMVGAGVNDAPARLGAGRCRDRARRRHRRRDRDGRRRPHAL